jgi:hypothetical protein
MDWMTARQLSLGSLLVVGLMVGASKVRPIGVGWLVDGDSGDDPAAPGPNGEIGEPDDDGYLCLRYGLFCPLEGRGARSDNPYDKLTKNTG